LKFSREPLWFDTDELFRFKVPAEWLDWLLDAGSLTQRMLDACDAFNVELLSLGRGRPQLNEAQAMGLAPTQSTLVRHVFLRCDNKPVVFARTLIPDSTLTGAERRLAHLGNKPLGAVLFADPHMQRSEVQIARICPGQKLFNEATQRMQKKPQCIWGRRSMFWLNDKPLLVNEIFLPPVIKLDH
jgi:chorismate--pyruvate lyase